MLSIHRLALGMLLVAFPAVARVHRIVVEHQGPARLRTGSAIAYQEIKGVAYGDLDPANPHNSIIQDLALAPRNTEGRVEYQTTFTLLVPADQARASGFLVYEVVNRGSSIVPRDYDAGDVFLKSGWQGDIPFRGATNSGAEAETIQLPVARNADGSSVTGHALLRFMNVREGETAVATKFAIGYASSGPAPAPVSTETGKARLISRSYESLNGALGVDAVIGPEDWRWADCSATPFPGLPDTTKVCLRKGFHSALVYQLEYEAKDPLVLGVGLAAIRDLVAFFRASRNDDAGWQNPIGGIVKHSIGQGASQSGNTIRTFLNLGFNQDEAAQPVWDGVMTMIAVRQNPINFRFAIPGGASGLYEPGSDGVVWWSDWPDARRRHATAGLLTRCAETKSCPKIVEVLGSSEFWSLRATPDFVGTDNAKDIPLPQNVRRYYIASTQHGGGIGGFHWQAPAPAGRREATPLNPIDTMGCVLPLNPNPEREIDSALLVALKSWVSDNTDPPPSNYPTLQAHLLVPANHNSMRFPAIPGVPWPDSVANPLLLYDFGDSFHYNDLSGVIAQMPPAIAGVVEPLVPSVDADGNEIGGLHTVLQQAALGTYLGWNVTAEGFLKGQYCSLFGSYKPFAKTKKDRMATGDPRLSLQERYGTQRGYMCVVRHAANELVQQRLLLQTDADKLIGQAQSQTDLTPDSSATSVESSVANARCLLPVSR